LTGRTQFDTEIDHFHIAWCSTGTWTFRLGLGVGVVKRGSELVRTGLTISKHAAERIAEHGVTEKMIQIALTKGKKFWDPKNKTVNFVLEKGFASGQSLIVAKNPVTGTIATVIKGNRVIRPRFVLLE